SGAVSLAHLDGSGTGEAAAAMVARVQQLAVGYPEGRLELQLVGGFTDPHRYSDDLFANIMCKYFNFYTQPAVARGFVRGFLIFHESCGNRTFSRDKKHSLCLDPEYNLSPFQNSVKLVQ
ncbi:jg848, partial [Pararge aegeria aegeria]